MKYIPVHELGAISQKIPRNIEKLLELVGHDDLLSKQEYRNKRKVIVADRILLR